MANTTSNFIELQPDSEALGTVSDFVNEFMDAVQPQHLFDDFSRQETALLSNYLEVYGVPRQSTVLRVGDVGDFLAFLITGKAVIIKNVNGVETVVHELSPGEVIGEISLFDGETRIASCVTTEPSDFAVLSSQSLNALLADHPRLGNKFLLMVVKLTAKRLRQALASPTHSALDASL